MKQAPKLFEGLKKNEKRGIVISLVGILLCFMFLNFYDFQGDDDFGGTQLGLITDSNNDIRYKSSSKVFWKSAKKNQAIRSGDKLFTGSNSTAGVTLKNNAFIGLEENSLVEFKDFGNEKLPDFATGSYRISGSGKVRIAINGKIAEINSNGSSEILMTVDEEKNIKFTSVNGDATVNYENKTVQVANKKSTVVDNRGQQKSALPQAGAPGSVKTYDYTLSLYDLYESDLKKMRHKSQNDGTVRMKVHLPMKNLDITKGIQVEHASRADFSNAKRVNMNVFEKYLSQVYVGDNHWRFTQGSDRWSTPENFTVKTRLLPNSTPSVSQQPGAVSMINGTASVPFAVSVPFDANGYVIEYGPNPDFQAGSTQLYWSYSKEVTLMFNAAGIYYSRFRGVDKDLKLGAWSETNKINVINSPPLPAPVFSKREYVVPVNTRTVFSWKKGKDIDSYTVGVYDNQQNLLDKSTVQKNKFAYTFEQTGRYEIVARATDSNGRQSLPSTPVYVRVVPTPRPIVKEEPLPQQLAEEKPIVPENIEIPRKPSSDPYDTSSEIHVFAPPMNKNYVKSNFVVSTAFYSFQSTAQADSGQAAPSSPGVNLSGLYWYNNHGFEGLLQKNLGIGYTVTAKADFTDMEFRYRFRLAPSRNTSLFRHFQWTAYAGYEIYSNANASFYVDKYNMNTVGTTLDIPIFKRWLMSMQAASGFGSKNAERKMSAGGEISYFLKRNWSLGFGYKLYLYQADKVDNLPGFAPYREGYTDANFNMKYYF